MTMKLRHWQGYGHVTATKVSCTTREATYEEYCKFFGVKKIKTLIIKVEGDHECGIDNKDPYDVYYWLVNKFDKTVSDYTKVLSVNTELDYLGPHMSCTYTIYISVK